MSLNLSNSPDQKPPQMHNARSVSTVRIGRSSSSRGKVKRNVSAGGRPTAARPLGRMPISRSPLRRPAEQPKWLPKAAHCRVERDLGLAAPGINEQLEADREQIGMLRQAIEGLYNMIVVQDNAYGDMREQMNAMQHLDHQSRQRYQELANSVDEVSNKLNAAGAITHQSFEELRKHINETPKYDKDKGLDFSRVDKLEGDLRALGAIFVQKTLRDTEVENYLQEIEGKRPREGEALMQAFKYLHAEIDNLKNGVTQQAVATAGSITAIAQRGLSDDELKRLTEMENKVNELYTAGDKNHWQQRVLAMEHRVDDLGATAAPGGAETSVAAGHSPGVQCQTCGNHGTPGAPGGSQDGLPPYLLTVHGGNGSCHCVHVVKLEQRVGLLEQAARAQHRAPVSDHRPNFTNMFQQDARGDDEGHEARRDGAAPVLEQLGPLGLLNNPEKQLYDDKLTGQAEYKFDGVKGGIAWKSKVERYFMSKVPALKQILKWAERHDQASITEDMLAKALQGRPVDEVQQQMLNASMWGFLSGCVSGTAEKMFNRAPQLNGLDAWRRLVRIIDNGIDLRLEELRGEVRMLHTKQIKDLESVPAGIAEFEAKIEEYINAGGTGFGSDREMKSDLTAILPAKLREDLLWSATDPRSFTAFRDMVIAQSARTLAARRRGGGLHTVNEEDERAEAGEAADEGVPMVSNVEELIAAFNKMNRNGQKRNPNDRRPTPRAPTRGTDERPPRKCANCGQTHAALKCPHPAVAVEKRKCWACGEEGHTSRFCKKKEKGAIKAVDEECNAFFVVEEGDDEGFTQAKHTFKARPMPRTATLADYMPLKNAFAKLDQPAGQPARGATVASSVTPTASDATPSKGPKASAETRPRRATPPARVASPPAPTQQVPAPPPSQPASQEARHRHPREQRPAQCVRFIPDAPSGCTVSATCPCPIRHDAKPELKAPNAEAENREQVAAHLAEAIAAVESLMDMEEQGQVNLLEEEEGEILAATRPKVVTIKAAIDSGAVRNAISPEDLPEGVEPAGNPSGYDYAGANGSRIKRYGPCTTLMTSKLGNVGCNWEGADVTRPLHSVSQVTGPVDQEGKQEVLFTNKKCVVVPPGAVEEILKCYTPVMQYEREGNLYLAELQMTSFPRPGVSR